MAKMPGPASTSNALMIAMVKGRVMVIEVPSPKAEWIRTDPPISSTILFTISQPIPRPDMSVISLAVLKPDRKMNW